MTPQISTHLQPARTRRRRLAALLAAWLGATSCLLAQAQWAGNGAAGSGAASLASPAASQAGVMGSFAGQGSGPGAAQGLGGTPSIRSGGAFGPAGAVSAAGAQQTPAPPPATPPLDALGPNEFQKFVQEGTGQALALYGVDFFQNLQWAAGQGGGNPFAPVQNTPVSADYPLGPGDEVLIRGWGSVDIDVRAVIDRNGLIHIPRVGAVALAGVRAAQAEGVISASIGRYYRDFQLNVTLGQLRAITVYVVGQARRPGAYNLSSQSTLVSGLFASGGPNANGSMRRVQLKRAGSVLAELDLYQFLAQGNKSGDLKLLDGDVIFIPSSFGHVALTGMVNSPAIYELKNDAETLESLLAVAGGLPVVADPRRATLERMDPGAAQPRSVLSFALNGAGLQTRLRRGDLLTVQSILPEFSNAVTLRGNVGQPLRTAWREGMRIRDLIPSREALISLQYVRRQNEVLLSPEQKWAAHQSAGQDRAGLPERYDYGTERAAAQRSGSKPVIDPADTLASRIGHLIDEVNMDYAVVERVRRGDLNVNLIPFNLGRVLDNADDPDNVPLQAGDVVTVFSVTDVRVPLAKRRVYVRIEGEVEKPGVYQISPGDHLQTLLDRAGGLTPDAYLFGAGLYRDEVRASQTENLEKLVRRLEAESNASILLTAQSQGASSDASVSQARLQAAQVAQRQSLERLRSLKPDGRISLALPPEENLAVSALPKLRLQNHDRFFVPSRPDFVYVYGAVNTESALIYRKGAVVSDYLEQAGLSVGADRGNVILLRADGSALTNTGFWTNTTLAASVQPGDTLILPEKLDRETGWSFFIRNAKDITQIFYQLGIGAAGLKALGY